MVALLPNSPRGRRLLWQILAVGAVALLAGWFTWNAIGNYAVRSSGFGIGFLTRPANIPIGETLIPYQPGDGNYRALLVGLLNSVIVAIVGIVLATVLGTILGVARISGNPVAASMALGYVELMRNVPLLAHLFVIYLTLQKLPPINSALSLGGVAYLSNRGLVLPSLHPGVASALFVAAALILGLLVLRGKCRAGRAAWPEATAALALAVAAAWTADVTLPRLDGRRFADGVTLSPEMTALIAGLTIYYAAFIAEIVRGALLAVPDGQWDAATSLGLTRRETMRLVILPQALRLMIPPTTSQYLDLAKMTSLAIAIGYPDLVAVANSIITDTGRAIECVALIMAAFLVINLTISAVMNWLNARIAPPEAGS